MPSNNTEGHFVRLGPKAGQELAGADHNGWPAPRDLRVHDFKILCDFLSPGHGRLGSYARCCVRQLYVRVESRHQIPLLTSVETDAF